ncbi:MAG: hypothetical protein EOM20_06510 [Spartobacteria bacterium]|nr:hypothetical protein [Spartobacteria bacterium]
MKTYLGMGLRIGMLCLFQPVFAAVDTGSFVFTTDGQAWQLEANEAPVNAILEDISLKTDIPVCLDERNTSVVSVNSRRNTLEALMDDISSSYSIIYVRDPDSGAYRIERIVSTSSDGEVSAECKLQESELRRKKVMETIRNAVTGITRYRQTATTRIKLDMPAMEALLPGGIMEQNMKMTADGEKFHVESRIAGLEMLGATLTVSDGKTMSVYVPLAHMVTTYDMEEIKKALGPEYLSDMEKTIQPFANLDEEQLAYMGIDTVNGKSMYVLEGPMKEEVREYSEKMAKSVARETARQAALNAEGDDVEADMEAFGIEKMIEGLIPDSGKIWVSTEDGMINGYTFRNRSGAEIMSGTYADIEINPPVDDELFTFTPPVDVTVNDMTDFMIETLGDTVGHSEADDTPEQHTPEDH